MGVEMSKSKEITGWVLGTYAMASKFRPAAVRTKIRVYLRSRLICAKWRK